jgi:hypothetical protein
MSTKPVWFCKNRSAQIQKFEADQPIRRGGIDANQPSADNTCVCFLRPKNDADGATQVNVEIPDAFHETT